MKDMPLYLDSEKLCSVPECIGNKYSKGYCTRHYRSFLKFGDPDIVSDKKKINGKHLPCKVDACPGDLK